MLSYWMQLLDELLDAEVENTHVHKIDTCYVS